MCYNSKLNVCIINMLFTIVIVIRIYERIQLTMYFCQQNISTLILNNRAISKVIIAAHLYQREVKSRDFKNQ